LIAAFRADYAIKEAAADFIYAFDIATLAADALAISP